LLKRVRETAKVTQSPPLNRVGVELKAAPLESSLQGKGEEVYCRWASTAIEGQGRGRKDRMWGVARAAPVESPAPGTAFPATFCGLLPYAGAPEFSGRRVNRRARVARSDGGRKRRKVRRACLKLAPPARVRPVRVRGCLRWRGAVHLGERALMPPTRPCSELCDGLLREGRESKGVHTWVRERAAYALSPLLQRR
jgi:hypothetical protein